MTDTNLNQTLVNELLAQRRADRRWRIIRFAIILICIISLITWLSRLGHRNQNSQTPSQPYVSLIKMQGAIMSNNENAADKIIPALNHAFADRTAKGVIIEINSPGGSPVQSSLIHDRIVWLKKHYRKKVVVFGEDSLASGAYLVSTAADQIFVTPDTLTGSIGVIMSGFGFNDAMKKLGISRRVFTAGGHKHRLDAFEPLAPQDVQKIKGILDTVHLHFINDVKQGRGARLKGDPAELYSGDFWLGGRAHQLGLVDGTSDLWTIMQSQFGVKKYRRYQIKRGLFDRLSKQFSTLLNIHLEQNALHLSAENT